jgi:hypothetical protein
MTRYQQEVQATLKVVMEAILKMLQLLTNENGTVTAEVGALHLETFHLIMTCFTFSVDDATKPIAQHAVMVSQ